MTADERLAQIRVKVERAKKYVHDFEVERKRFMDAEPYTVETDFDPNSGYNISRVMNLKNPPAELGLIAGDIIHNLRSALDHLVWQLVEIGCAQSGVTLTKRERQQIGFPIWQLSTEYHAQRHRRVKGMSQATIDAIEATEPYEGGKGAGLWVLNELDIADKHHGLLVTIMSVGNARVLTTNPYWWRDGLGIKDFALPNFGKPLKDGDIILICDPTFQNHVKTALDVALAKPEIIEGKPLIVGLQYFIELVDNLIVSFKPLLT
jgi:hypothetical protein